VAFTVGALGLAPGTSGGLTLPSTGVGLTAAGASILSLASNALLGLITGRQREAERLRDPSGGNLALSERQAIARDTGLPLDVAVPGFTPAGRIGVANALSLDARIAWIGEALTGRYGPAAIDRARAEAVRLGLATGATAPAQFAPAGSTALPSAPPPRAPATREVFEMPFIPSSLGLAASAPVGFPSSPPILGGSAGGFSLGTLFGTALAAAPDIIRAFRGDSGSTGAVAAPGGAPIMGNIATSLEGYANRVGLGVPGVDLVPNQTPGASLSALACITPTASGIARLPARVQFMHGNRVVSYRNEGRPLASSGDVAAKRRIERFASKYGRRRRGGR